MGFAREEDVEVGRRMGSFEVAFADPVGCRGSLHTSVASKSSVTPPAFWTKTGLRGQSLGLGFED